MVPLKWHIKVNPRGTLTFVDGKFPVPQRDPSGKNVERKTQKRVELRN